MIIIDSNTFKTWALLYRNYIFKGGSKPKNNFPYFFKFYVFKNTIYCNIPDNIICENHYLNLPYLGSFILKGTWDNFYFKSIADFNQEKNISYFAKKIDYLEIKDNTATYELNLNMERHIGKVIFEMQNAGFSNQGEYILLPTRIFLPELHLTYIDKLNMFEIIYTQNQNGIGVESTMLEIKYEEQNETTDILENNFYFNKPFTITIYIDEIKILSIYIDTCTETVFYK